MKTILNETFLLILAITYFHLVVGWPIEIALAVTVSAPLLWQLSAEIAESMNGE